MGMRWSRSGIAGASAFAALFAGCLLLKLLGNEGAFYLVGLVTLPFSLVTHEAANLLQDTFALTFEMRSWAEWMLLGVAGVVEFYVIGYALGSAWRKQT